MAFWNAAVSSVLQSPSAPYEVTLATSGPEAVAPPSGPTPGEPGGPAAPAGPCGPWAPALPWGPADCPPQPARSRTAAAITADVFMRNQPMVSGSTGRATGKTSSKAREVHANARTRLRLWRSDVDPARASGAST